MKQSSTTEFATIIRRKREEKGWSQAAVAASLGMSDANYGNIERGQQSPTLEQIHKIAEALETSVADLIGVNAQTNIAHQPVNSAIGIGRDYIENNHFNEKQAEQVERLLGLFQDQNKMLERLAESLYKLAEK